MKLDRTPGSRESRAGNPRKAAVLCALMLVIVAACGDNGTTPGDSTTTSLVGTTTTSTTTVVTSTVTTTPGPTTTTTPEPPASFDSLRGINTVLDFAESYVSSGASLWNRSVPGVQDVRIPSTADGHQQPAFWVPPSGDWNRPLLVALHSWSTGYDQHASIPFAMWAKENGWAFIAPNFRGSFDRAESMGSEPSVQDVIDAIDWAITQGGVNPDRVYLVGFSGGGMMSLLIAGRHPDRITAAASWTPVYDLVDFHFHNRTQGQEKYSRHVRTGCGGNPETSDTARAECLKRSPLTYLDGARGIPVLIGQGIADTLVPPSQAAMAFNQLADGTDRFSEAQLDVLRRGRVPESITDPVTAEHFFGRGDPGVAIARSSGSKLFVLFRAGHEMVYGPALRWFATDPR